MMRLEMNFGPQESNSEDSSSSDSERGITPSPGFASLEELLELLGDIGEQFVNTAVVLQPAPAALNLYGGLPVPNFAADEPIANEDDPMSMSPSTDFNDDDDEELENLSSAGNTPKKEGKRYRTPAPSPVKSPTKTKRPNFNPD